jgi:tetratricopeptide (TPR) repeat protein
MGPTTEEIIKKATGCLRQGKNTVSAEVALGIAYFEKGNIEKAIHHYLNAVARDEKSAEAHAGLGISYGRKGNLDKTVVHLSRALELAPECGMLSNWLADAYFDQGDLDQAMRYYAQAIRCNASDSNAHNDMADVFRLKGDYASAIGFYEKTLEIDPLDTNAMLERAQCLVQLGQHEKALEALHALILNFPASHDCAAAKVVCGALYLQRHNYGEALVWLDQALEHFPFNRIALFQAAVAAMKLHRYSESAAYLQKILDLDPDDSRARSLMQKVITK